MTMTPETLWTWMSIGAGGFAAVRYVAMPCRRGLKRITGAMTSVDQLVTQVGQVHQFLGPNGGKSLGDLIRKIDGRTQVSDARIDLLTDLLDRPVFECAPTGENVRVNEAFTKVFGWSPADMFGQRWVRILHPDDRQGYMEEWARAVKDMRAFSFRARYLTRSGVELHVQIFCEPNFDEATRQVLRWLGRVETLTVNRDTLERKP